MLDQSFFFRNVRNALLAFVSLLTLHGMFAQAQTLSLDACARQLEDQGFRVVDRELEEGLYEFEALQGGQEWEIKTDFTCKVLLKRVDD